MKHLTVLSLLASILFTSCSAVQRVAPANAKQGSTTYLSVEIFQTLNKNAALAWDKAYKVVKIESLEDMYYDGKKISGMFVLVDTFTYETKNDLTKTVPVYIRSEEYKKLQNSGNKL